MSEADTRGLGKRFLQWLTGKDRRRAERRVLPGLVAYYWDGGTPVAHDVREISSTGMFLLTHQRWYLGTLIVMTLQNREIAEDHPYRSITVRVKVAQVGANGVGLAFVRTDAPRSMDGRCGTESNAADKRTIDEFIHRWFQASRGKM